MVHKQTSERLWSSVEDERMELKEKIKVKMIGAPAIVLSQMTQIRDDFKKLRIIYFNRIPPYFIYIIKSHHSSLIRDFPLLSLLNTGSLDRVKILL